MPIRMICRKPGLNHDVERHLRQRNAGGLAALGQELPAPVDETPDFQFVAGNSGRALTNGFEPARERNGG